MRFLRSILTHILFKTLLSFLIVFVLYDFTVCTGITFDDPYTPMDMRGVRGEGRIRLVSFDRFPTSTVQSLASFYKKKYDLNVEVASPLHIPAAAVDSGRRQLISDVVIDVLQAHHPQLPTEPLTVIGLVEADMYIPEYDWKYAISYRKTGRYAVVSTARLYRGCLGIVPVSNERMTSRLRKMVTKNIGILYFHLPLSDDPRSVLYRNIGGPQEFDRMSEDF
jgi:predicted Zn-dependent protease